MMKRYLFVIVSVLAMISCAKNGPAMPEAYIEVDKDYIVVPSFSVAYTISVESNTQWKLNSSVSWVSASISSGAGNSDLQFTILDNTGDPRSCVVELVDVKSTLRKKIQINQNGNNGPDYMPVATIRGMESASEYNFTSGKLKAFVLSDYASANYKKGQFAVGDSFVNKLSGINVITQDGFVAFEQGAEVDIDLKGAKLSRVNGILSLTLASRPVQTQTSQVDVVPITITYEQFTSGEYESMFVKINNFQVLEEFIGGSFVRNPVLEDEVGNHVLLRVVEDAAFSAELYNRGKGDICGIAREISSDGVPTLEPTELEDAAFTRLRFGKPGVESLPYVFSFFCREDVDGTPKYLIYNEIPYNPATQLVQGLVAQDEDESIAATLELTAFGKEESNINSGHTHFWAEYAGHDNVMCTGFVSQDCKTTPTAECGWWWSVPLKMDLPPRINFSFGLAGTDYALREWQVSYSKDKSNWYVVDNVIIDVSRSTGTFYLYYTLGITLAETFSSGDTFYIKLTPQGSQSCNGSMGMDGHGSSCQINLHSALVISEEVEQRTKTPEGAIYFEPFDKLTKGMDYFYGEKLAAMLNYSGEEYSSWTPAKKSLLELDSKDIYERPGYVQIGFVNEERAGSRTSYNNYIGSLIIPPVGETGDYTLTFKAARYRNACVDRPGLRVQVPDIVHPDISKGVVRLLPEDTEAYFEETKSSTAQFSGMPHDKFKTYSLTVKNATADTRICFTSAQATTDDFTRWFIDDITITK